MTQKESLITHINPKSPASEAYRVLRTNIQFSSIDKPLKTILVTSSGPKEGKTTTITNLAITFAQSGAKTLLIDADLRIPKIYQLFDFSNAKGLTNILVRNKDYKEYLKKTDISKLDVIVSGPIPPNPSELLGSSAMKNFLAEVSNDYDIILIDTPPVVNITDAAILSTIVDGTILVAASKHVEINVINRARELLEQVKANIVGVVLNKIDTNTNGNYYYYYYGEDM